MKILIVLRVLSAGTHPELAWLVTLLILFKYVRNEG